MFNKHCISDLLKSPPYNEVFGKQQQSPTQLYWSVEDTCLPHNGKVTLSYAICFVCVLKITIPANLTRSKWRDIYLIRATCLDPLKG